MSKQPTMHFRWVERPAPANAFNPGTRCAVLQQGWASSYGGPIEWRDVPVEPETPPTVAPPAGWRLVPERPDIGMLQAALAASRAMTEAEAPLPRTRELWAAELVWAAMLAAAPQSSSPA